MKKKVVTLTESQLVSLIKNTVKKVINEEKRLNEGVLLTLGGIAIGAGIIKKAYDFLTKGALKNKMVPTGKVKKSSDGKFTMKQYEDKDTGEMFWGIDLTDKTRDEGYRERKVLLFKDDPKKIEHMLASKIHHDFSDEASMSSDHDKKFGQFKADKVMHMGKE